LPNDKDKATKERELKKWLNKLFMLI
jgi:hypothetical protein